MKFGLPIGADSQSERAAVKRRALDIGKVRKTQLDSRKFEVEYDDGTIKVLTSNIITKIILADVDDGYSHLLIDEIIYHRRSEVAMQEVDPNNPQKIRTTKGWDFCVQWKDGSTSWVQLKDMKNWFMV